jgi:hypothetical protein
MNVVTRSLDLNGRSPGPSLIRKKHHGDSRRDSKFRCHDWGGIGFIGGGASGVHGNQDDCVLPRYREILVPWVAVFWWTSFARSAYSRCWS